MGYQAQMGGKRIDSKPLKGIEGGVLEVVTDHRGDTFNGLHGTSGQGGVRAACVPEEIEAEDRHAKKRNGSREAAFGAGHRNRLRDGEIIMPKKDYVVSSGNVFADLGVPNAEELLAKAELAHKIAMVIIDRKLTQMEAAKLLGVDQPKISALLRGRLTGFSLERLMRYLLLLGQDIKITVQACPRSRSRARVRVA